MNITIILIIIIVILILYHFYKYIYFFRGFGVELKEIVPMLVYFNRPAKGIIKDVTNCAGQQSACHLEHNQTSEHSLRCKQHSFYESFTEWKPQSKASYKTVVSLTTLPERLVHTSFLDKCLLLKEACSHDKNCSIQINIPFYTMKSAPYVIPTSIQALQSDKFHIYRDILDLGPITKLMGALKNPEIDEESYIIIVDDDIAYKKDFVKLLQNSFDKNPGRHIHCMCYATIEGFKGFGFQKKILMKMVDMTIPKECIRIDDDYIKMVSEKLKISVVSVPYYGDTSWYCSFNLDIHNKEDKTIQWDRLKYDDRTKITPKCKNEFDMNTVSFL